MHSLTWFYYLAAAGFGLIFGSFFNVVIYRLPRGEGLGKRSHCTTCEARIKWYDNIPVLSFALLGGKCRSCREHISWRYPLIELSTSALFVISYLWSRQVVPALVTSFSHPVTKGQPLVPELFIGLIAVSVLIIATGTDIDHGIIPNEVTYSGIAVMAMLIIGLAIYRGQPGRIGLALLAAFLLGGVFLVLSLVVGAWVNSREGHPPEEEDPHKEERDLIEVVGEDGDDDGDEVPPMAGGMGDVKVLFFLGLAVGYFHWYFAAPVLLFSAFFGLIGVIITGLGPWEGRRKIRFAPYLAAGGLLTLFLGQQIVDLYLKLLS